MYIVVYRIYTNKMQIAKKKKNKKYRNTHINKCFFFLKRDQKKEIFKFPLKKKKRKTTIVHI